MDTVSQQEQEEEKEETTIAEPASGLKTIVKPGKNLICLKQSMAKNRMLIFITMQIQVERIGNYGWK
jgi:hypothetical protein